MKLIINKWKALLIICLIPCYSISAEQNKTQIESKKTVILEQVFEIILPSNPTTGYTWILKQLPKQLVLTGITQVESTDCKEKIGCQSQTKMHFKAIQLGKALIKLQYARPWEQLPKETTDIVVKITK